MLNARKPQHMDQSLFLGEGWKKGKKKQRQTEGQTEEKSDCKCNFHVT